MENRQTSPDRPRGGGDGFGITPRRVENSTLAAARNRPPLSPEGTWPARGMDPPAIPRCSHPSSVRARQTVQIDLGDPGLPLGPLCDETSRTDPDLSGLVITWPGGRKAQGDATCVCSNYRGVGSNGDTRVVLGGRHVGGQGVASTHGGAGGVVPPVRTKRIGRRRVPGAPRYDGRSRFILSVRKTSSRGAYAWSGVAGGGHRAARARS